MNALTALDKLLSISSEIGGAGESLKSGLPAGLSDLYRKNGLFAFESALEVFPLAESAYSYSLPEWNERSTWRSHYQDLAPEGLCFAQDLFGGQFLINDRIYSFDPETAEVSFFADTVEGWAELILADYEMLTAQPLAHAWQAANGPLPKRSRLAPITPFVLGGAFDIDNLMVMDAVAAMRLRASLALQIKDLPDGAQITYEVD